MEPDPRARRVHLDLVAGQGAGLAGQPAAQFDQEHRHEPGQHVRGRRPQAAGQRRPQERLGEVRPLRHAGPAGQQIPVRRGAAGLDGRAEVAPAPVQEETAPRSGPPVVRPRQQFGVEPRAQQRQRPVGRKVVAEEQDLLIGRGEPRDDRTQDGIGEQHRGLRGIGGGYGRLRVFVG